MPGQGGAFHPRRELRDAGKYLQLTHVGTLALGLLAGDHTMEVLEYLFSFLEGFSLEALGHHGRRSFRDGASVALERNVPDYPAVRVNKHGAAVAAKGVVPFRLRGRLFLRPVIARSLGVFEYQFLVQIAQFRHQPSISFTRSMPATS